MSLPSNGEKYLGGLAIASLYQALRIPAFFQQQRETKEQAPTYNAIFRRLVCGRLLLPDQMVGILSKRNPFFAKRLFTSAEIYQCFQMLSQKKDVFLHYLQQQLPPASDSDSNTIYCSLLDFYFDTDEHTAKTVQRFAAQGENLGGTLVNLALFLTEKRLPYAYTLSLEKTFNDQSHLPALDKIPPALNNKRLIYISEAGGLNNTALIQIIKEQNGYIVATPLRNADRSLQQFALDKSDYQVIAENGLEVKSCTQSRSLLTTTVNHNKEKITLTEKHLIVYSKELADQEKETRAATLRVARDIINHPDKYTKANAAGAAKYLTHVLFDPTTGKLIKSGANSLRLDLRRLREEEKLDGYGVITTSELAETDARILELAQALDRMKRIFTIFKGKFPARPSNFSKNQLIEARFLVGFTAFLIIRLLKYKLASKYRVGALLNSLRKATCHLLENDYYLCHYYDEVLRDIGSTLHIDFSRKYLQEQEILNIVEATNIDLTPQS